VDDIVEDAQIGRRYAGVKDKRDRMWTEVTKDLVLREALERSGYEFEETDSYYYIFEYLKYVSVPFHCCSVDEWPQYKAWRPY
jgi:hypothetical protein